MKADKLEEFNKMKEELEQIKQNLKSLKQEKINLEEDKNYFIDRDLDKDKQIKILKNTILPLFLILISYPLLIPSVCEFIFFSFNLFIPYSIIVDKLMFAINNIVIIASCFGIYKGMKFLDKNLDTSLYKDLKIENSCNIITIQRKLDNLKKEIIIEKERFRKIEKNIDLTKFNEIQIKANDFIENDIYLEKEISYIKKKK